MFDFPTIGFVSLMVILIVPLSGMAAALYLGLAMRGNARRREGRR